MRNQKIENKDYLSGKKTKIGTEVLIHLLLWVMIFSLPLLFLPFPFRGEGSPKIGPYSFPLPLPILLNYLFLILTFYVNLYVLMPKFLNKKKWGWYVLFIVLFLACSIYIHELSRLIESTLWPESYNAARRGQYGFPNRENFIGSHMHEGPSPEWRNMGPRGFPKGMGGHNMPGGDFNPSSFKSFVFRQFSFLYLFFTTWVISMAYHLFKLLQQSVRHADKVLSSALQSELSFLKAQINPHFLFNTLNNIYVLTLKKSEMAPTAVMKLSNLMRTLTNDTGVDYVEFSEEQQFIRDYLELQELRLTKTTRVVYETEGESSHLKIAPRILLPFIDNAFKYGVSNRNESEILIRLTFTGNTLNCLIQNAIHRENTHNLGSSGVGLGNSKRRLDIMYKDHYQLSINETDKRHEVLLKIDLT